MDSGLVEAAKAQLQQWYPQFGSVVPPLGTAAVRAWRGRIQPFPDGSEFVSVMEHLQTAKGVRLEREGKLAHPNWCKKQHAFFLPFTDELRASFDIVLLSFESSRHPRVYAVRPEISRRAFPFHPHLRDDQGAIIDRNPVTALCIYLASDGVLQRDEMELVHTLDFTSMFLAKHLVWTATSLFSRVSIEKGIEPLITDARISRLLQHEQVFDGTHACFAAHYRTDAVWKTMQQEVEEWLRRGYWYAWWPASWVGPTAPHYVNELVQQVDESAECHCGSGQAYGDCHREQDQPAVAGRAS